MKEYFLTVYSPSGELLLNETIKASSDEEAKTQAEQKLTEENYTEHTHRLTHAGKLILFHR